MPIIEYTAGQLAPETKKRLIEELTRVAVETTGTPSQFFNVVIHELADDNIGVAGETVADLKARMGK